MSVRIQLMGMFLIEVDGVVYDNLASRSRRGVSLIRYLILQEGQPVSAQRLIRDLRAGRHSDNPEGALKTLISRTRAMLNGISPGLGKCIVSEVGGYCWHNQPGVEVDVLHIQEILERLRRGPSPEARRALSEALINLYRGDLDDAEWMHKEYLDAVYDYAALLNEAEEYNKIVDVCDRALAVDKLDEHLHILRMAAMKNLNRNQEAMDEYRQVARQSRYYFDAEPSEELQSCYRDLVEAGKTLRFNLDVIHNELTREEEDSHGPYFCEYRAFKVIYNIQIRSIERLGATMSLGVVMLMLDTPDAEALERGMDGLRDILSSNLRRGDIVTRFSENIYAMLLPTVNYSTGNVVIERIEHLFYDKFEHSGMSLFARISPISSRAPASEAARERQQLAGVPEIPEAAAD